MGVVPKGALALAWLLVPVWGLMLLGLVGCADASIAVEEGNGRPKLTTPVAAVVVRPNDVHDVAVTAIDFDPPLGSRRALDADRVSLLAVIENRGNEPESRLIIEAKLFGGGSDSPLVESESMVDKLVPGESKVVRFYGLPVLPIRGAYRLDVVVRAVPGELALGNNTRTYRVEMSLGSP